MPRPGYIPSPVRAVRQRKGSLTNKATWVLAVLLLAVLVGWVAPVFGQQGTTIAGHVVNGTAGAGIPQAVAVSLVVSQAGAQPQQRIITADNTGQFAFEDVPVQEGATYTLTAVYLGIEYTLTLSPQDNWSDVRLAVHEATSSLDDISIGNNILLVLGADSATRTITFLETLQLTNKGDRVLIPNMAQGSPMDLLRLPLPAGAFDLDVQAELPEGQLLQVDRGFAMTTPVPPGEYSVLLSYKVPYSGARLDISRVFLRGAGSFRLLIPEKTGNVFSRTMADRGVTTIGTRNFRLLELTNISSDTTVDVLLEGLPQPSMTQRIQEAFQIQSPAILVPVALLLALATLLVVGLRRGGAPQPAMTSGLGQDRTSLVQAIAALDDRFQSGDIEETAYQRQRGDLKAHLLRLAWQEETQHGPGREP